MRAIMKLNGNSLKKNQIQLLRNKKRT